MAGAIDYTKLLNKLMPEVDGEDVVRLRVGIVDAVNTDGTLDVGLSGFVFPDLPRLESAEVEVGDNVQIAISRGSLLVLGRVATHGPAWISYSIGNSGWTPGNAVLNGRFQVDRSKNILHAKGTITFGTTTVVSSNLVIGTVAGWPPINVDHPHIGHGLILQGSNRYMVSLELNNTSQIIMVVASTGSIVGSATPGAWASGHVIRFQFMYEIAQN